MKCSNEVLNISYSPIVLIHMLIIQSSILLLYIVIYVRTGSLFFPSIVGLVFKNCKLVKTFLCEKKKKKLSFVFIV